MKTLDSLFPVSKKARLEEEGEDNCDFNIEAIEPNINEDVPENITENIPGNIEIINKLNEVQATVLKSIDDLKHDLNKINKDKQDDDECYPKKFSAIDNARTISEIINACPELENVK